MIASPHILQDRWSVARLEKEHPGLSLSRIGKNAGQESVRFCGLFVVY